MADTGDRDERDSIWSVARGTLGYYFALFTALVLVGVALLVWRGDLPDGDLATRVLYVWQESGSIVVPSAGYAIIILEGGRWAMVLAGMFEAKLKRRQERRLAEAEAKARAEARHEANAEWRAWLDRMRDAQAKGEPFDEPPPSDGEA